MNKIAILYICTGRYKIFFPGFYHSAEKYLLIDDNFQKEYFVWTDDLSLSVEKNVHLMFKKSEGFPADSLFRFEMFLQAEEELKKFDYIYFFNANAKILRPIGTEILPDESGLAIGIWPGKREQQHPVFFPYERNPRSLAYVAPFEGNYTYFMGGLNGGTSEAYLSMIHTLHHNIRDDYKRGIIAKVHDESHINAYLRHHKCKKIGREYCIPEEWITENDCPKNIFRNKVLIDPYFNKGRKSTVFARVRKGCSILVDCIRWYLKI